MNKNNGKHNGRKTILTLELEEKICELIRDGNTNLAACGVSGIDDRTLYLWIEKGNKGKEPYKRFMHSIKKAEAERRAKLEQVVYKAGIADRGWQAASTYLERTTDDWKRYQKIDATVSGKDGKPIAIMSISHGDGEIETWKK